jgi:hypothetical protein
MNPTTEPREGFWWFSGYRRIRGTQRVFVDEPVCVCYEWHGYEKALGVKMLGRSQHFRLESFIGTWQAIVCEPRPEGSREGSRLLPEGGPLGNL